jgi:hypothetical protein
MPRTSLKPKMKWAAPENDHDVDTQRQARHSSSSSLLDSYSCPIYALGFPKPSQRAHSGLGIPSACGARGESAQKPVVKGIQEDNRSFPLSLTTMASLAIHPRQDSGRFAVPPSPHANRARGRGMLPSGDTRLLPICALPYTSRTSLY